MDVYKQKESDFISKPKDRFDIARDNALNIINIEEDKEFLNNQRLKESSELCMESMSNSLRNKNLLAKKKSERFR